MTEKVSKISEQEMLHADVINSEIISAASSMEIEKFIHILNITHHTNLINPFLKVVASVIADAHRFNSEGTKE